MKGVVLEVTPDFLAQRKRRGLDRWDEMWQGVLHMTPAPSKEHQRILTELLVFLAPLLKRSARGTLLPGINVFNESSVVEDYRIPDLTFVAAGRESLLAPDGVRGGAPDAVVEIRSPNDESYDKLAFFAALGTREVIVVDRDTKRPEVFRLAGAQYLAVAVDGEGWLQSECLHLRLKLTDGSRLALQDLRDPSLRAEI